MNLEFDPPSVADALAAHRSAIETANVASWRAWMSANLEPALALSDAEIERRPSLIAWLFPSGGASRAHPEAPVIGRRAMRRLVATDPALQDSLARAFDRMVAELGLEERQGALCWQAQPQRWAAARQRDWRVYRMLRCVHNAGLEARARMLMAFLEQELGGDPARAEALSWFRHQVAS